MIKIVYRIGLICAAFIASGALALITRNMAVEDSQGNGQLTQGFLWLLFCPIWMGTSALAAYSGQELGGLWRVVGWLPLFMGLGLGFLAYAI